MPAPGTTRPQKRSREEIAREEIGHTEAPAGVKWFLALFFLAALFAVPAAQIVFDLRAYAAGTRQSPLPGAADLVREIRDAPVPRSAETGGAFDRVLARDRALMSAFRSHEDALADDSWISAAALRPVQSLFTDALGIGNEEVCLGRGGMLFYRPDLEHLWGRGFLDGAVLRARRSSGDEWRPAPQPDPLPAILQLAADLRGRGIALVVAPAPLKASVCPELFTTRARPEGGLALNASFAQFTNELAHPALFIDGRMQSYPDLARNPAFGAYAVAWTNLAAARDTLVSTPPTVFDAAAPLLELQRATGRPAYLKGDTHWTPEGMEAVARSLASTIRGLLPAAPPSGAAPEAMPRMAVTNIGDTASMLKLPPGHLLLAPETALIRPVACDAASAAPARILLLGDSFSNIYSQEGLGWGTRSGLAEQLSLELGEPVARIAVNAGGAHAARAELARRLATARRRQDDPLEGVCVVVYEFAMRELSSGDWKLLPLGAKNGAPFFAPSADGAEGRGDEPEPPAPPSGAFRVSGAIADLTRPPAPESVPYEDAVVNLHLVDLRWEGEPPADAPDEILVYAWGMKKRAWRPVATMKPGDRIALDLVPWETVMDDYGSYNRTDFEDFDLLMLPPFWGEPPPKPQ